VPATDDDSKRDLNLYRAGETNSLAQIDPRFSHGSIPFMFARLTAAQIKLITDAIVSPAQPNCNS
jgi:hypothetical protein